MSVCDFATKAQMNKRIGKVFDQYYGRG
jgi:hypothetical protein